MSEELSYVLFTPHSLHKSRTGGILSRLISRSGLELVAGRMFTPSKELVEAYARSIVTESDERHRHTQELIREYVLQHFVPDQEGRVQRVLMLVLRGPFAIRRVLEVAGHIVHERTNGETIRDTYGDYVVEGERVLYFEPAVLVPPNAAVAESDLRLWAIHAEDEQLDVPASGEREKTLVLLKPDNFRFPNARPGGLIDVFSRTGLRILAFDVIHMSVEQAERFYGPLLPILQDKFRQPIGDRARRALERELGVKLSGEVENQLGDLLGSVCGYHHWETILEFMVGMRPSACPPSQRHISGTEKCVALVYEGVAAVQKIREVLGPTDPSKAPLGSIRREFGQTIMVNAAHASDSTGNAIREMGILRMGKNNLKAVIESHFRGA